MPNEEGRKEGMNSVNHVHSAKKKEKKVTESSYVSFAQRKTESYY